MGNKRSKGVTFYEPNRTTIQIVLILILLLGLILRVSYCFQIKNSPYFEPGFGSDTHLYDTWAQTLANGDWVGKEVFWAAPGYPYFLGIIYSIFGRDLLAALLIQALLGTISCFLIFLIAKQHFGNLAALIAAFLAAAHQMFVFHDAMLVGSSLSVFLNCLGLYLLTGALKKPQWWRFVISGLVFGAAILTNISPVIFILMVVVWLTARKQFSFALMLLTAVTLTISPVTLRNYLVAKDFVPITAHGGLNFYIGNNPKAKGFYAPPELMVGSSAGLIKDSQTLAKKELGRRELKPSEVSSFWFKKGLKFIKTQPGGFVTLAVRKAGLFINAVEIPDILNKDMAKRYCSVLRWPLVRFGWVFALAVIGLFASWPLLKDNRLLFFFLAGQMISCLLYFVNARYRLPAAIALIIFAAYAIFWLIRKIAQRRALEVSMAGFAALLISVISYLPLYYHKQVVDEYGLALIHQRNGRFEEAEKLLKELVRSHPNFDNGYYALGYLYWQQGRREEAILSYKKALSVNPNFAEVRYNLGYMYSEDGKLDDAQRLFESALSLKPDYKEVLANLCTVCSRREDREPARQCWQKVLEFDPDNSMAQQELMSLGSRP